MKKIFLIFLILLLGFWKSFAEEEIFQTLDEKIGKLFVIPFCPMREEDHWEEVAQVMERYHIGGILLKIGRPHFNRSNLERGVKALHFLKERVERDFLVFADVEPGLDIEMEEDLKSDREKGNGHYCFTLPKNLTLGAISELEGSYEVGREIGKFCKMVGIDINLAPVVDINTNSKNPVIHMRSFGEDPLKVTKRADGFLEGLEAENVIGCLKHFPGHGDTAVDSHLSLPLLSHDIERMKIFELVPYFNLAKGSKRLVMTSHIAFPKLCEKEKIVTFSKAAILNLNRNISYYFQIFLHFSF